MSFPTVHFNILREINSSILKFFLFVHPQPYLASMESVHQDEFTRHDLWTREARTDHFFHRPFVMARTLDAGSDDAFTSSTSELRGKEIDPQPNRVGFKQDYPKTTPKQCPIAFKCVNNKSVKAAPEQCLGAFKRVNLNNRSVQATPQRCLGAFKRVYNESGLLSYEWMKVCKKEDKYSPTLSP